MKHNYVNKDKRLTVEQCYDLLKEYNTPERVIHHCEGVADCAVKIAEELNKYDCELDIALIRGAALIHDIARVKKNHGKEGAIIARKLGYEDEARIIEVHMFYPEFNDIRNVQEVDIVCLGDRTVKEDKYVGLDRRIEYIVNKADRTQEDRERIFEKMQEARIFIGEIEELTGKSLDEIVLGKV